MMEESRAFFMSFLFICLVVLGIVESPLYLGASIFVMVIWQL